MNNVVSLDYLNDYNFETLSQTFESVMERLKLQTNFKSKMKVLIKVCMPEAVSQDLAESTHPAVVRTIVDYFSNKGVKCIVADCPNKKFSNEYLDEAYINTGVLEMANLTKCDLNRDLSTSEIEIPDGVQTKSITVLDLVNQVDAIINVGKLKIDEELGYLGACHNLFSLMPVGVRSLVLNRTKNIGELNDYIVDMISVLQDKIKLNVIDGIVAQEAGKTQRMLNCLAVSENPFSLDAAMCDILNIQHENTILKQAQKRGMINSSKAYKIDGEKIETFRVSDFGLIEFDELTKIKTSKGYFKAHQQRPSIDKHQCKGCTICSKICPTNAILMKYDKNNELYAEIDYSKCIYCNKCITACPYSKVEQITPVGYKKLQKTLNKYNTNE